MAETIRERLEAIDPEMYVWDNHDDAVIGVAWRFNDGPVVLYEYEKIIQKLMADGCSRDDAIEYFEFNIIGGWLGPKTPIVAETFTSLDEENEMSFPEKPKRELSEVLNDFRRDMNERFDEFTEDLYAAINDTIDKVNRGLNGEDNADHAAGTEDSNG